MSSSIKALMEQQRAEPGFGRGQDHDATAPACRGSSLPGPRRPATKAAIAAAEARLGSKLPASYLRFVEASNGWGAPSGDDELFPVEFVGDDGAPDPFQVRACFFDCEVESYAERGIVIGGGGDDVFLLLRPDDGDDASGEWQAAIYRHTGDSEEFADFGALLASFVGPC